MSLALELRQKRQPIIEQMKDLATRARTEQDPTRKAELNADFYKAEAEERRLTEEIRQLDALEAAEKRAAADHIEKAEQRGELGDKGKAKEYREAFTTYFKYGAAALSPEERAIMSHHYGTIETRAQSTTTTAGGYLIAPEYMVELERSVKDFSGVMQAARIITTSTGANIPYPTNDSTSRVATLVAENATSTPTDFVFGTKALDSYTYRDMAAVSLELMQDSAFDIPMFITDSFGESFGRGLNAAFTTGTGSAQPNGVVTASTVGNTAASATAFTRAEMVEHLHKVDPGYRRSRSCGWMFSDTILGKIKQLALGSNDATPLWQASMRDGAPETIEGFPYWINQDMSTSLTTGQKIMLFGDFSKYIVRRVLGMSLRRLEERFIDSGQIGFIAFARYDGELMNTAAVKHFKLA